MTLRARILCTRSVSARRTISECAAKRNRSGSRRRSASEEAPGSGHQDRRGFIEQEHQRHSARCGARPSFRFLRRRARRGSTQAAGQAGSGTVSRSRTSPRRSAVARNFVRGCVGWGRSRRTGRLRMRGRHRSRPATRGVTSTRRRCRHQELARGARRTELLAPPDARIAQSKISLHHWEIEFQPE